MKFREEGTILEGGLWYETKDGEFLVSERAKAERYIWNGYIHSIARGAPNIEEIAFNAGIRISHLVSKLFKFFYARITDIFVPA